MAQLRAIMPELDRNRMTLKFSIELGRSKVTTPGAEQLWFSWDHMLVQSRKLRGGGLVELKWSYFVFFCFFVRPRSHNIGNKLLLFNLLDLCPVGRCLRLVIGLPARERRRLRSSFFQPWRSSGARTDRSVFTHLSTNNTKNKNKNNRGMWKPMQTMATMKRWACRNTQKHSYLMFKSPKTVVVLRQAHV